MTTQERDYEDLLRRALRAAAESVEPAADGLDRIRGRVSARRVSPFMLLAEFLDDCFRPIMLSLESGGQALGRVFRQRTRAAERPRAAHRSQLPLTGLRARLAPAFTRLAPAASWLKPVLAVGGAVGIVVAGVFTLGQVQQAITPANQVTRPGASHHRSVSSPPASPGAVVVPPTATPTSTAGSSLGARPAATCTPSPKVKASSGTPDPSVTPTPTVSVTPTTTPSDSSSPIATPTLSLSTNVDVVATVTAKHLATTCSSARASAKAS
jgi:hypothetical protein